MKDYENVCRNTDLCAGIYIHVPFCVRKCSYCDFLSAPADSAARQVYVEKLKEELDQVCHRMLQKGERLSTVYFGGGTPSLLTGEQVMDLMGVIERTGLLKKRAVCMENAQYGQTAFGKGTVQRIDSDTESEKNFQRIDSDTESEKNFERIDSDTESEKNFQKIDTEPENKIVSLEITLEMNPGTVTREKLQQYKAAGINRLSIGLQSFHDEELQLLGRIHTARQFREAWQMAREAGFTNISVDLMSGLPGQTAEQWRDSLRQAAALHPEHISAYSLIIEEGTPFYERYGADWSEAHEDLDREMYEDTNRILEEAGYHRYEISNYAKPGRESRHNSSYWTGIPYYGCGLGASSLIREADGWYRTVNLDKMQEYLHVQTKMSLPRQQFAGRKEAVQKKENSLTGFEQNCSANQEISIQKEDNSDGGSICSEIPTGFYQEIEKLSEKDRMEEFMFLGLRLTKGVSKTEFFRRFGVSMDDLFGKALKDLTDSGLLLQEKDGDRIHLTAKGLDLSNYCFAQFLLD